MGYSIRVEERFRDYFEIHCVLITCPIQPISFEFLPIVSFEDPIHANDVSRCISSGFSGNGLDGWPGNCGHFVILVVGVPAT